MVREERGKNNCFPGRTGGTKAGTECYTLAPLSRGLKIVMKTFIADPQKQKSISQREQLLSTLKTLPTIARLELRGKPMMGKHG
jgi:hypothetical protein